MRLACEKIFNEQHLHKAEHILRKDGLDLLCNFYDVVTSHGHFLPAHASQQVLDTVHKFLLVQNSLTKAYAAGVEIGGSTMCLLHYNVTFKSHCFWHMAQQSKHFNPKAGLCY